MKADAPNIKTHRVHITFFPNQSARTLSTKEMTLEELRDLILATTANEKTKLAWLKFAKFGNARTPPPENCLRNNDNVLSFSGIEGDYDLKQMSFETAYERLKRACLMSLLYTSPSYTKAEPKWRVLCPLSRDLPPEQRAKLLARLNGVLGGVLSDESFTLSQSYYFGSVDNNPDHRVEVIEGDYIDQRPDLDAGALGKSGKPQGSGNGAGEDWRDEQIPDDVYIERIRGGGEYHTSLLALSARQIGRGMEPEAVVRTLQNLMNQSKGPRDRR
jgi:hypothetical protein